MAKLAHIIGLIFIFFLCANVQANHSKGLHLQLSDTEVIDFSLKEIQELHVFKTSTDHASVMLVLSSSAASKFARLTQNFVGAQVAWVWNGRVLGIEKLKTPLSKDLTIYNLTSEEAEDFRKAVIY